MIREFVDRFMEHKASLEQQFAEKHPESYRALVSSVVGVLGTDEDYGGPDPERIHEIDDGSYQGTLVYVIAETGYQPSTYWYVRVGYGSCSGCDALEGIRSYDDDPPSPAQAKQYISLALHIVQGLKKMGGEEAA
jgi:hypothetical protein